MQTAGSHRNIQQEAEAQLQCNTNIQNDNTNLKVKDKYNSKRNNFFQLHIKKLMLMLGKHQESYTSVWILVISIMPFAGTIIAHP